MFEYIHIKISYCLPLSPHWCNIYLPILEFWPAPEVFLQDLPGRWRQGQLEAHAPEALIAQGQDLWRATLDVEGFSE